MIIKSQIKDYKSFILSYLLPWPSLECNTIITPLMSVTNTNFFSYNVGAIIAALASSWQYFNTSSIFGFIAIILAAINIFWWILVTQRRMLSNV